MKTAIPSVFPAPAVFDFSCIHVDLSCINADAKIYYTTDGSEPTLESPVYDRAKGLIPLKGIHGQCITRTIKAFAKADSCEESRTVSFEYMFKCPAKGEYRHQLMREPSESAPGIIRIEDHDLDKMFLVIGPERAVLVDAGWDSLGDLPALCQELIGDDRPIDLVVAHGHPDHIVQAENFLKAGHKVYVPHKDIEIAKGFGIALDFDKVLDIHEGMTFDLGCTTLRVYSVSGHTPGGVVLVDENTGDVYSSDELGSCRRYVGDSAWLQLSEVSLEYCLHELDSFMKKTEGKLTRIFSGHNDDPMDAASYLSTLRKAYSDAVQFGNAALKPSLRSALECFGAGSVATLGDWRYDPVWAAANIRYITESDKQMNKYAEGYIPNMVTEL